MIARVSAAVAFIATVAACGSTPVLEHPDSLPAAAPQESVASCPSCGTVALGCIGLTVLIYPGPWTAIIGSAIFIDAGVHPEHRAGNIGDVIMNCGALIGLPLIYGRPNVAENWRQVLP